MVFLTHNKNLCMSTIPGKQSKRNHKKILVSQFQNI